jgi:hypothetical protein
MAPATTIGKSIDSLDFASINLPALAYLRALQIIQQCPWVQPSAF